ncbi:hypothetical protein R1flu_010617 [Riccia fluitans]|uniref:Uncharacterized protein n=1 Tax=Riccia fluitans TaxID=41844 RepID=A0ABD1Z5N5_9MARC
MKRRVLHPLYRLCSELKRDRIQQSTATVPLTPMPVARLTVVAASYSRLRSPRCPSVDSAHPPDSRNHHPLLRYGCKERAAFSAVDEIANALPALEIESQKEK